MSEEEGGYWQKGRGYFEFVKRIDGAFSLFGGGQQVARSVWFGCSLASNF